MKGHGYYIGSLNAAGGRVRAGGLFARGNGRWVVDEAGLSFLRRLTRTPIVIPRERILSVVLSSSSWWGGRWLMGARVVEVRWALPDGTAAVSGFIFSGKAEMNAAAAHELAALAAPGGM